MKCPKCDYLGFETGDRCKNCGYDFSLTPAPPTPAYLEADLFRHPLEEVSAAAPSWDGAFNALHPDVTPTPVEVNLAVEERFPLFSPAHDESDEPLIKLPAAPRPPLAVRRTPDTPRLRAVPRKVQRVEAEPVLEFADAPVVAPAIALPQATAAETMAEVRARTAARLAAQGEPFAASSTTRRMAALGIDHLLLCAIDLSVLYLTVRMADLPMSGWTALPLPPLVVFLVLLKFSYFCVFTAVGGQTIGKMAARIRVVTAENQPLAAAGAAVRSLAGTLSAITLGLGYVPAFVDSEHRALHDRLARTRVVTLPPV